MNKDEVAVIVDMLDALRRYIEEARAIVADLLISKTITSSRLVTVLGKLNMSMSLIASLESKVESHDCRG